MSKVAQLRCWTCGTPLEEEDTEFYRGHRICKLCYGEGDY